MSQAAQVVVGGGLNGLMLTDLLQQVYPEQSIFLLEASPACGGLLRSFDYGEYGLFDYGTHILSETGKPALDRYVQGLLPIEDWCFMRGTKRNLAGLYFANQIQHHSKYPDLTALDDARYGRLLRNFFSHISDDDGSDETSAYAYLVKRYGQLIADEVASPIVEKFARYPADQLDVMVTHLCPLDRLAMFDEAAMQCVVPAPVLGQRVAYVDQRNLPDSECSPLAAFYPKKRGMQQLIDALLERLNNHSQVTICCETTVETIEKRSGGLTLTLSDGTQLSAAHLHWTANLLNAASPLGIDVNYAAMQRPLKNALCHFSFASPTALGDLYYLYCADPQFQSYRYTNYHAYCPDMSDKVLYPITVELLLDEHHENMVNEDLVALALHEMLDMGLVDKENQPIFSCAESLGYGFARPTLDNQTELSRIRTAVAAMDLEHLSMLGIGAQKNLFFMSAILLNTYAHAERLMQERHMTTHRELREVS